jgi:type II secretory pathway pseudopilin PulG
MKKHTLGFSMVELVLVIAMLGIAGSMIAPGFMASIKSYNFFNLRAQALSQARAGMDRLVSEARLIPSQSSIVGIAATNFQFQYPAGTAISYNLNGTNLRRNTDNIIQNISSLSFTYYNEAGTVTASTSSVRSVGMQFSITPPGGSTYTLRSRIFLRNTGNLYGSYDTQ